MVAITMDYQLQQCNERPQAPPMEIEGRHGITHGAVQQHEDGPKLVPAVSGAWVVADAGQDGTVRCPIRGRRRLRCVGTGPWQLSLTVITPASLLSPLLVRDSATARDAFRPPQHLSIRLNLLKQTIREASAEKQTLRYSCKQPCALAEHIDRSIPYRLVQEHGPLSPIVGSKLKVDMHVTVDPPNSAHITREVCS